MMGTKMRLFTQLPPVTLDELVPAGQFYRHLDRVLDLDFVRALVRDDDAEKGRPSIDPMVFFKLQLVISSRASTPSANCCGWRQIASACVGTWATIWTSPYRTT